MFFSFRLQSTVFCGFRAEKRSRWCLAFLLQRLLLAILAATSVRWPCPRSFQRGSKHRPAEHISSFISCKVVMTHCLPTSDMQRSHSVPKAKQEKPFSIAKLRPKFYSIAKHYALLPSLLHKNLADNLCLTAGTIRFCSHSCQLASPPHARLGVVAELRKEDHIACEYDSTRASCMLS